jgi:hypothetical protein
VRNKSASPTQIGAPLSVSELTSFGGRVGRSAAGRALDEEALRAAVVASIRHRHTNYDRLLMKGWDQKNARDTVREDIDRVLG